jgi:hypothetical protein
MAGANELVMMCHCLLSFCGNFELSKNYEITSYMDVNATSSLSCGLKPSDLLLISLN